MKLSPEDRAERSLFRLKDKRIFEPSTHIHSSMIAAASEFQIEGKGKKTYKELVTQCIMINPERIPHIIQKWEPDMQRAVINKKSAIMACRGKLERWKLRFVIWINDPRLKPETLKQILEYAGRMKGIGTFRQRFGKFKVSKFDVKN